MTTSPPRIPRLGGDALAGWRRGLGAAVERLDRVGSGVRAVRALGIEPPTVSAGALLTRLYAEGDAPPEPLADPVAADHVAAEPPSGPGVTGDRGRAVFERIARRPAGGARSPASTATSTPVPGTFLEGLRTLRGAGPAVGAEAGRTTPTGVESTHAVATARTRPRTTESASTQGERPILSVGVSPAGADPVGEPPGRPDAHSAAARVPVRPGPAAPLALIAQRAGRPELGGPPWSASTRDLPSAPTRSRGSAATAAPSAEQGRHAPVVRDDDRHLPTDRTPDAEYTPTTPRGSADVPEAPAVRRIWSEHPDLGELSDEDESPADLRHAPRTDANTTTTPHPEPGGLAAPRLADRLGGAGEPGGGVDDEAVERVVERMLADAARRHGIEV